MRFAAVAIGSFTAVAAGPQVADFGAGGPLVPPPISVQVLEPLSVQGPTYAAFARVSADDRHNGVAMITAPGLVGFGASGTAATQGMVFLRVPGHETMPTPPDIPAPLELASLSPLAPATKATPAALAEETEALPLARITANALNMRSGPAKRFPAMERLSAGDEVEITGPREGGWLPVRALVSGETGWVFHKYVAPLS